MITPRVTVVRRVVQVVTKLQQGIKGGKGDKGDAGAGIAANYVAAMAAANAPGAANAFATLAEIQAEEAARQAAITAAINALLAGVPSALDTLNELAVALGNDANFAASVTNALAGKESAQTPVSQAQAENIAAPLASIFSWSVQRIVQLVTAWWATIKTILGQYDVLVAYTPTTGQAITHDYRTGGAHIDCSAFGAGGSLTIAVTNWPTSGSAGALFVYLKAGANLPTMSYTGKGSNVTAPTLTASRLHRLVLSSIDAGTTVDVSLSGVY